MSAVPSPRPVRVEETSPRELEIAWSDGAMTYHLHRTLRFQCHCAQCREEMTGKLLIRLDDIPKDIRPRAIEPVGNYALRFVWSDGHRAGLYTFGHLREIAETRS